MRHTLIDELNLNMDLLANVGRRRRYESAFISVKTPYKKPRYCSVYLDKYKDGRTATELEFGHPTEDEFNDCLDDDSCLIYDIFCNVAKKVSITVNTRFPKEEKYQKRVLLEEDK